MKKLLARLRRRMTKQFGRKETLRRWAERDFHGADFSHVDFSGADFSGMDFSGADFRGTNFRWAQFSVVEFRGADFRSANFSGADFHRANFMGADFSEANFRGADFSVADFSGADFPDANFSGANFSGANFAESTGVQWADCSWHGHGECGRRLLALRLAHGIRYFCGCFSGNETELRDYIATHEDHLAPSRLRALEFCRESFT